MNQQRRASHNSDYLRILEVMVKTLGLQKEEQMSAELLSELTGESETIITKLRTFAGRIGGLKFRYEARIVGPSSKGVSGRKSFWKFVMTAAEMDRKAKREWGFTAIDHYNLANRMGPDPRKAQKDRKATNGAEPMHATVSDTGAKQPVPTSTEETQIQRELRKVRKNDAEALVEAVRQYNNRESFIKEELKRFADMGIEIDPSAIKFDTNESYEVAGPLVELIDRLMATVDRQSGNLATRQSNVVDPAWRKGLEDENARLKADLSQVGAAHKKIINNWSHKVGRLNSRIKTLEDQLHAEALKNLQGHATATPIGV